MVDAPDQIDLPTIAWHVGHLTIEVGELETAEGRLIARPGGGVIRVRKGIKSEGRQRFVIAHEIGHYCLHKANAAIDSAHNFTIWRENSIETEANTFAGELLMPQRLFQPQTGVSPALAAIDLLAHEYRTSSLATAVQFVHYSKHACAVVLSKDGEVLWSRKSRGFTFWLRRELHKYAAATELRNGSKGETGKMFRVPAGAWIDGFSPEGDELIREDSRFVPVLNVVVSLLWADKCI